ncbi:AAA family ATPase [Actinacidiphila bryophytorum]|uniref:AAA family ATPase n=2 Tax=Actinacidiphila bryophytorum TaxID=1436133 RepID=A0A9W4GY84_9ACTN|nr:MoxR family ATPase [Actinacidiphila bryophytorum]CAG7617667.1 AAA family ATPase [Actinacidiphila bryophytorum]
MTTPDDATPRPTPPPAWPAPGDGDAAPAPDSPWPPPGVPRPERVAPWDWPSSEGGDGDGPGNSTQDVPGWWIYRGAAEPHDGIDRLPEAPPWRSFTDGTPPAGLLERPAPGAADRRRAVRASRYQADREEIHLVNMALLLRRPLLVTGRPGLGKSTLAYSIARELRLGPVLRWSVTSRTTLQDGQYQYDAIGRLQDVGLHERAAAAHPPTKGAHPELPDIGRYLRLGPLGTALLPWRVPRVLLIDEIDKSDVDFPSDLLHVFEEGEFTVPELARLHRPTAEVMTADDGGRVTLEHGRVSCHEFPLVILTSNEEREFPPAFLRRCIRLEIRRPDRRKLARLLAAHLPPADAAASAVREDLITTFLRKQDEEGADLANDQLLNAVQLARQIWDTPEGYDLISEHALRPLNEG